MKTSLSVLKISFSSLAVALIVQLMSCVDSGGLLVVDNLCNHNWVISGPDIIWECQPQADYYVSVDRSDWGGSLIEQITFDQWSVSGDIKIIAGLQVWATEKDYVAGVTIEPNLIDKETSESQVVFSALCPNDAGTMVNTVLAIKKITIKKKNDLSWSGELCLNSSGLGEGIISIVDDLYLEIGTLNCCQAPEYEIVYSPTVDQADIKWIPGTLNIKVNNFSNGGLPSLKFGVIKHGSCNSDLVQFEIPTPTKSCQ